MTSQVFITIRIFFNIIKCFIKNYIFIKTVKILKNTIIIYYIFIIIIYSILIMERECKYIPGETKILEIVFLITLPE